MPNQDRSLLEATLIGYEAELERIESAIEEIDGKIGGKWQITRANTAKPSPKRILSSAARKRIAAAQKKRWAEFRGTDK
jgi:hypothetical protein